MAGLRVFLSSTATDLVEYRKIADDTLLRLQQQSVVMERFGAMPGTPVAECEQLAASSDLVVSIVAHRYGYEPEAGRGSITRREVEAARRAGKPVYAWIVDDSYPWSGPKEQDRLTQADVLADPAKASEVMAAIRGLQDFKAWLRREVVVETFTNADDLGRKIGIALANIAARQTTVSGRSVAPAPPPPELRIVHALQPAPHFKGRNDIVRTLSTWVDDTASPDRVHALVAAGGTGKTAIAEQVIAQLKERWPPPGAGSVLVWSFYEKPDADAFVRECGQLFLAEPDDAPAGGRLERLQRGLRDGRPHLIVLDGLERVQAESGTGQVRGELEDHTLKLLLQAIAAGLGRTRVLVTSRFPLTDLRDWHRRGVVEIVLDDLTLDAARQVLRGWGVCGSDAQLDAVSVQVGRHALSVAVVGSYLSHVEGGRIEAAATLQLDVAAGDDPKAAKLARVLGFYAERLPAEERELLTRLSVFPRGITLDVLGMLIDAGGRVAGVLVNARPALTQLLARLRDRGLVFRYSTTDGTLTWTAHPFVRQRFAGLLGYPPEAVFEVVATRLGQGLEQRPERRPEDSALLDRYEQLIEATQLAGRVQEAFDLYWVGLGHFSHLGFRLGEYARGFRILSRFLPTSGNLQGFAQGLDTRDRSVGLADMRMMALYLGRLDTAANIRQIEDVWKRELDDPEEISRSLQNTSSLAIDLGRLGEALAAGQGALDEAERGQDDLLRLIALGMRAATHHQLGNVAEARHDFAAATALDQTGTLRSFAGQQHARHHLDLGELGPAHAITEVGLPLAKDQMWNFEIPRWHGLLARLALARGQDPSRQINDIRDWTARTGQMQSILEAHYLAARAALARGDASTARVEAEDGLRQARQCGYVLRQIELLVTLSAIELAWPNPGGALAAARAALDLATAPECGDAWGEADAAHGWGLAFEALGEREHAQRAFAQALAVRERITHPQAEATRQALARLT
jgi:tetratricopeptide (TPR) repeat protein